MAVVDPDKELRGEGGGGCSRFLVVLFAKSARQFKRALLLKSKNKGGQAPLLDLSLNGMTK